MVTIVPERLFNSYKQDKSRFSVSSYENMLNLCLLKDIFYSATFYSCEQHPFI